MWAESRLLITHAIELCSMLFLTFFVISWKQNYAENPELVRTFSKVRVAGVPFFSAKGQKNSISSWTG